MTKCFDSIRRRLKEVVTCSQGKTNGKTNGKAHRARAFERIDGKTIRLGLTRRGRT